MIVVAAPESVPYYYGHITRENAELVLFDRGCVDGMYLLRSSHSRDDDYVLSLCYERRVIHYRIIRDVDGLYYITGMEKNKYVGPVELIQNIPEFVAFLNIPCLKPLNVFMPGVNCCVPEDKLKEVLKKKADEWGIQESEFCAMMEDKRSEIWRLVLKTLHECESWFHGRISREEAELHLATDGLEDGKFLVRERDDCSFSLSLCHISQIKHYKIDVLSTGEVGIQDGPRFENIISLVSHYSVFNDGLWCQLRRPCPVNNNAAPLSPRNHQDVSELKRSGSKSDILQEFNSFGGKSIYPCLPKEDLVESNQSVSKSVAPKDDIISPNKCSSKKGTSFWFINHKPKANGNKASFDSSGVVQQLPPPPQKSKVPKPPKGKHRRLTPLDISAPVITRRAPSPPLITSETPCVHPTSNIQQQPNNDESHLNSSLVNKMIAATLNEYTGPMKTKEQPPLPNPLSLHTNVPSPIDLQSISNSIKSETVSAPKKPLPAPRQKKSVGSKAEPLSCDVVAPSDSSVESSRTPFTLLSDNSNRASELVFKYPSSDELTVKRESSPTEAEVESVPASVKTFPWMVNVSKMPNVIAELKERSNNKNLVDRDNHSVLETGNEGTKEDMNSCGTPQYEEIDPQFEKSDELKLDLVLSKETNGEQENNGVVESLVNLEVTSSSWDVTKDDKPFQKKPPWTKEESELHFKTIRRYRKGPMTIDRKNLIFQEKLGLGNFGDVVKAIFKSGEVEVPCAIKTLRQESISSGKEDLTREARMMTKMDHPHIVRLLGVSEGDPFLLVMELAPLGPLNFYVKRNRDSISQKDILMLVYQVALGMEYLESKQFVHRDLAARNVLLVNESFAKISDFGMSRAIGLHSDYYRVEPQAKLPLKWYAPECIYYFRFSCKSDVWSYGITLWEALSYGEKPYVGLSGREILTMFNTNQRLARPENCSDEIYAILWKCWQFRPEERPTFAELTATLKTYFKM